MSEEKTLLEKANEGDLDSIKELAEYYDKKSGRWRNEPQLGEIISIEEFFANADRKADENFLAEAFKFYLKAAQLNDPESMREVGHRLYDGIGTAKDEVAAFAWYEKDPKKGLISAMRVSR